MTRRALTEPKTALAGVWLITSFAMFRTSIAIFSEEMTLSRRFGGWVSGSIAKRRRSLEKRWSVLVVREKQSPGPDEGLYSERIVHTVLIPRFEHEAACRSHDEETPNKVLISGKKRGPGVEIKWFISGQTVVSSALSGSRGSRIQLPMEVAVEGVAS